MNQDARGLYRQIKSGEISPEQAARQIQEMVRSKKNPTLYPSAGPDRIAGSEPDLGRQAADEEQLRKLAVSYIKRLFSSVLKLPAERIEANAPMDKYGIDSVMIMELTEKLEQPFGPLPKTLFYEYQTIQELVNYFWKRYRDSFASLLEAEQKAEAVSETDRTFSKKTTVESAAPSMAQWRKRTRNARPDIQPAADQTAAGLDIAIIGLAGRYPGARNVQQFWEQLSQGEDCVTEIPADRWEHNRFFDEEKNKPGKTYCKWGGFLDGVDEFDPLFFQISPLEAEGMDPQERLFLQCVYETIEDAGYARTIAGSKGASLGTNGPVGVYVGVMYEEYQLYGAQEQILGRNVAVGGNSSSIANRVSYFFNFHGPSIALNTMCSSSLTAVHLACQSLQRGECSAAIAGGVNVSVHPNKYLLLGQGSFVSSKGRCESFGEGGDGYVPGEGVGAILLKPLANAIADGDHIYGVIKGTAVNHGGKTNGYTVPNPHAQAEVIRRAFQEAGTDPRTVSYIEAHGTGTALGDPIEIAGLSKAFEDYTPDKQYCSIGSVKSNIGHCESAAGIAGITKILLQMKHRQLVPSLHAKKLNRHIDFASSPFYVQQELQAWQRPVIGEREFPRIAGISSFGAGGANAHLIIEEYIENGDRQSPPSFGPERPAIIVLSARDKERLREKASHLLAHINKRELADRHLLSMAYTLQTGRDEFKERLAMTAGSINELKSKLEAYLDGGTEIDLLREGQAQPRQEEMASGEAGDVERVVDGWLKEGVYAKLLEFWVHGGAVDWGRRYIGMNVKRMSLPTYPFERKRYWLERTKSNPEAAAAVAPNYLHPMIHVNTSNLTEQRFRATFTGQEFFAAGHIVQGRQLFPGAACLEMLRAAVEYAAEGIDPGSRVLRLKNVTWQRPIVFDGTPVNIQIGVHPQDNGEICCTLSSESNLADEWTVHSEGTAALLVSVPEAPELDLQALLAACSLSQLSADECYDLYAKMGVYYGEGQQGISFIKVGENGVLARLKLPASAAESFDSLVLHPSLLDGAIQAGIGLQFAAGLSLADSGSPLAMSTPFALDELIVYGPCRPEMWASVRYSSEGGSQTDKAGRLDIDLLDEQGAVCVRLKGLSMIRKGVNTPASSEVESASGHHPKPLLQQPVWDVVPAAGLGMEPSYPSDSALVIGGTDAQRSAIKLICPTLHELSVERNATSEEIAERLEGLPTIRHIIWIAPQGDYASCAADAVILDQEKGVIRLFRLIKSLLNLGFGSRELFWTIITAGTQAVHPDEVIYPTHAGVHGLTGSMAKEWPDWKVRLIDLEPATDLPYDQISMLPPDPQGNAWAVRRRQWYRQKLLNVNGLDAPSSSVVRRNGVYVVLGGAGGIGEAWSAYMIRTYQAQMVWIGRRPQDADIGAKIERLAQWGPAPVYIAADAGHYDALLAAYEEIKAKFGVIHGVVHSTVGMMDQSLAQMDEPRFLAGLTAKIDVSVRMAQVFGREPLDFALFFSSIGSFGKLSGQSGYAAGCTFADAFALRLRNEWPALVKVMNWGYWGDIGIGGKIPQSFKNRMAQSGLGFIEPADAMAALETLLSGPFDQLSLIQLEASPIGKHVAEGDEWIEVYSAQRESPLLRQWMALPQAGREAESLAAKGAALRDELDRLLCRLLLNGLQRSGVLGNPGRLPDKYTRWYEESLFILEKHGMNPSSGGGRFSADESDAVWQIWEAQKKHWSEEAGLKAQLSLAEASLQALPEILTGKQHAVDVLFPDSSMEHVKGIYKNNEAANYFNKVLSDIVLAYIEEHLRHDPAARIRILEIGAGTGGTSDAVLKRLKPVQSHMEEYAYTDLSKAFLMYAEKEYGPDCPYLTTSIFNAELPLSRQSVKTGSFDIVIAANVLHATKNIRQTIRNVKSALKPGGLIVMNELGNHSLFTHLTFGLLDGWWLYEDKEIRMPGGPGVSAEGWKALLEQEGFKDVLLPAADAHALGQQIIAALSDGIVRVSCKPESGPSIRDAGGDRPDSAVRPVHQVSPDVPQDVLLDRSLAYFKKMVGDTLKIPVRHIDPSEPLENYGIDSILVVQMTNTLRKAFGEVSSTLFFEYQTLDAVVRHFIETRKEALIAVLGLENSGLNALADAAEPARSTPVRPFKENKRFVSINKPTNAESLPAREPIAIIGLSGRYPQANNLDAFWERLQMGADCITEVPADRWAMDELFEADPKKAVVSGKSYSRWGGFVDGFAEFDPLFFNISPREALSMDPQERLFIMSCWEVLEDAGYTRERLAKQINSQVGVFAGITKTGFELCGSDEWKREERIYPHTSFGSVANRVSYLFNLQGPSMPIDTMCSSSLTAVHEACEHLYRQECEMAIAGGVNLYVHPSSYIGLSAQQMLSSDGRCKSFGMGGNGFVPGEGVGAVLLKPLSRAISDQDHIYAVIRATAINHGGKTNGYTVPNPAAQGELIRKTLDKAGVHARTVSYIEAHGTGTELGDPIEIAGLTQAFAKETQDTGFCSIGSVKSNIGHLEAAAGIAGLTKIILQMKHRKLVPSLHAEQLNPNIPMDKTPFMVQRKLEEWKKPIISLNGVTQEYPRIAGISSFGAGGANAHVVVEEYIPRPEERHADLAPSGQPALIVLSAKNEGRLKEQALRLRAFLEQCRPEDAALADIAYTLQTGREAMEERLALIVHSMEELQKKLQTFIEGREEAEYVYRGHVKRNKDTVALFADEEMQEAVARWIERKKYTKLMDLWVKGLSLDWDQFYGGVLPRRFPLPTYPFAKERYWMPAKPASTGSGSSVRQAEYRLHPLLHRNTSDLTEQRYSSNFTGEEIFLRDHRINGRRVLPGVAYLEMARAAIADAQGGGLRQSSSAGIKLKNVVWLQPVIVGEEPAALHIALYLDDRGEIAFEIFSLPRGGEAASIIHCQGVAAVHSPASQPVMDSAALMQACRNGRVAPEPLYKAFLDMGIDYGPGHRAVEALYVGDDQILAKLVLPAAVSREEQGYVLHPSLLDSALQAPLGYYLSSAGGTLAAPVKPALPYALQELEVIGACTSSMWVLIRQSQGSRPGDKVQRLDIDLADEAGRICVRMTGYTSRVLEAEGSRLEAAADSTATLLFEPGWEERQAEPSGQTAFDRHMVFICGQEGSLTEWLSQRMQDVGFVRLHSDEEDPAEHFQACAAQMLEHLQAILRSGPSGKMFIQLAGSCRNEQRLWTGLYGMLQTAQMEHAKLGCQLIEMEPEADAEVWRQRLLENRCSPSDSRVQYREGKRLVGLWNEMKEQGNSLSCPWKDKGIYIITGGAGNLGLIFAAEMIRQVRGAVIILTGRSPLSDDLQIKLQGLESPDNLVEYRQVDAADREAVAACVDRIVQEYGRLDGVIHSAGIIRDRYLLSKSREEQREVMAPKVNGLIHIDEATRGLALDFFIIFSSLAALKGNAGQGDYAAANAFMDAYAEYREFLTGQGKRHGRTFSVNWPLWQDGGMQVTSETERWMNDNLGIAALPTPSGVRALLQGFAAGQSRITVVNGRPESIRRKLFPPRLAAGIPAADAAPSMAQGGAADTRSLLDKLLAALASAVSKLLKVKCDDIDIHTELSEYGCDSISFTQFANELNQDFKLELAPTVFFEHGTLAGLAAYLLEEYGEAVQGRLDVPTGGSAEWKKEESLEVPASQRSEPAPVALSNRQNRRFAKLREMPEERNMPDAGDAIAIVGVSGCFPMAKDIDEFWSNLAEGKDCISEIPADRWDWKAIYGDPMKDENKTNIKWGGFIEGVDEFDPLFFGISPREAELMDPQQRLLMTYAWKAIEDAGMPPERLSGTKTGIFVGTSFSGYSSLIYKARLPVDSYSSTGLVPSVGPNRMSYFLNIHGPSEPVETACSSSLVAIVRAVNAIQNGSCEMAIAGGVNTIVTPDGHISFNKAGMLAEDGRCKTFSDQANGYVRSEGAGMLFLKKLSAAERDGNVIYGLIRGAGENHGGRAASLTAPNPKAQTELLKTAYTQAGIDPGTVTYIETHGTGTGLGDPIEINGLKAAFRSLREAAGSSLSTQPYCGLGSVKSNIGHAELAAGITGVVKVLLQMKHKTLVKSLHCETINPYIQLKDSPFYIVQEKQAWEAVKDKDGNELPRRAGVSSFGFGGANAHVILEEYVPQPEARRIVEVTPDSPAVIVLSAKNEERLLEQAKQLLAYVQSRPIDAIGLADIAYTLQTGREAMEERLGTVVSSVSELVRVLQAYVQDGESSGFLYRGQAERMQKLMAELGPEEEIGKSVIRRLEQKAYANVLELWVRGCPVDWHLMYRGDKPRLVSLPTYPFARERYWIPEPMGDRSQEGSGTADFLHPLLHRNTSDFSEQRFESLFSGEELFFKDHQIDGQRVFPGAAYLEMARAAAEKSFGGPGAGGENDILLLKNIVWARALTIAREPAKLHIALVPKEPGQAAFEIYSEDDGSADEPIMHSKGLAVRVRGGAAEKRDLPVLQAACSHSEMSQSCVYEAFKSIGIEYGPSHRGIEALYIGDGQILAKLALPEPCLSSKGEYVLHPGMLDAALQATIGFLLDFYAEGEMPLIRPHIPFALQEIEIRGGCTTFMWALVRYSEGSGPDHALQKLDIDMMDAEGSVRVRLKGYSSRAMNGERQKAETPVSAAPALFGPVWLEQPAKAEPGAVFGERLVMLCEPELPPKEEWESRLGQVRVITLQSQEESIADRYQTYASWMLEELQALLRTPLPGMVLIQLVFQAKKEQQLFGGLFGLLQTAALENPRVIVQCIGVEQAESAVHSDLLEINAGTMDARVRYVNGKRYVGGWETLAPSREPVSLPWKDCGVYVIAGGAGGLGLILAGEIARRVKTPVLLLAGSTPLSPAKAEKIGELEKLGAQVVYEQVDLANARRVHEWIGRIRQTYGRIDGVIHCAGLIRDNYLLKKTQDEVQAVLAPKVNGVLLLDEATKDIALDFFLTFSSIAAMAGSTGQGDYAAANAFLDAYAHYRAQLAAEGLRHGRSLTINWPLWRDGGMKIHPETAEWMRRHWGMESLETAAGLQALYRSWAADGNQVSVVTGQLHQMQAAWFGKSRLPVEQKAPKLPEAAIPTDELGDKTVQMLKQLLAAVIKLPAERIHPKMPLEKYGIDSLMILQLNSRLEETFGSLSKTLFFEYQTLDELSGYFLANHRAQLLNLFDMRRTDPVSGDASIHGADPETVRSGKEENAPSRLYDRFATSSAKEKEGNSSAALDIAIVGVAGRYPGAADIRQFWSNLRDGKVSITEIPAERWDYRLYYDEDKTRLGKTNSKWGGFIEGVDRFDPLFFHISPREAEIMDPQERLFLQCAFEVLEDAGYTRETLNKRYGNGHGSNVGVYVGVMYEEYQLYGAQEQAAGRPIALAGSPSSIANRVSYFFNFHGPSMAVDTMCSSSLTAIHLACHAILRGECEQALAGGVNVSVHPNKYLNLGQGKFVSSKGRCESFGEGGDGYVPSEGVGALLLKPLHLAVADGDHIYGVIKGTALNHGGKTNGYTVPNPNAQADVIGRTLKAAGFDPRTVSYIEAHGTGTSLGDPIEITGLTKAFQSYTTDKQFCSIGSVKSNIGHCESAAGIAGITKVLLQMKHRMLVPSLHAETLNPNIEFSKTPFVVQQKLEKWERPQISFGGAVKEFPRRAGVSAFGAGGSNVHLLLEEFVPSSRRYMPQSEPGEQPALILLSAKQPERLREQAERLLHVLLQQSFLENQLADIGYTLQVGREAMEERLGIIADSLEALKLKLKAFLEGGGDVEGLYRGRVKRGQEAFLTADEESSKAILGLLRQGRYGEVLALWSGGTDVDWQQLYGSGDRQRVSLPTYPFAKERYWIPAESGKERTGIDGRPLEFGGRKDEVREAVAPPRHSEASASVFHQMKLRMQSEVKPLEMSSAPLQPDPTDMGVRSRLQAALVRCLSELLEVDDEEVDLQAVLDDYGVDQVKRAAFIQRLNQSYDLDMKPVILLEYPTIHSLADYLAVTYAESLAAYFKQAIAQV